MYPRNAEEMSLSRHLLRLIADKLNSLPEDRFDYSTWVDVDAWKGAQDLSCGAPACALGWGATIPEIQARGMFLATEDVETLGGERGRSAMVKCAGVDVVHTVNGVNAYKTSVAAAAHALLLSEEEAGFLFTPESEWRNTDQWSPIESASAGEVADHIEHFIADHRPATTKET